MSWLLFFGCLFLLAAVGPVVIAAGLIILCVALFVAIAVSLAGSLVGVFIFGIIIVMILRGLAGIR